MLTRSEFCKITDVAADRLKSMAVRGQLPHVDEFELSPETAEVKDYCGWRRYCPFDALLLILLNDLAREGGLSLDEARRCVGNTAHLIRQNWDRLSVRHPSGQLWVGLTGFTDRALCADDPDYSRRHVAGTLVELAQWLAGDKMPEAGLLYRLVLVNASAGFELLLRRAKAASIALPHPESMDAWMTTWRR